MATKKKALKVAVGKKAAPAKATATKVVAKATASKNAVVPKAAPKKKAVAKAPVTDKSSALQKIAALQAQVTELQKEAVSELKEKLAEARKVVRGLENELVSLTGKPVAYKR